VTESYLVQNTAARQEHDAIIITDLWYSADSDVPTPFWCFGESASLAPSTWYNNFGRSLFQFTRLTDGQVRQTNGQTDRHFAHG